MSSKVWRLRLPQNQDLTEHWNCIHIKFTNADGSGSRQNFRRFPSFAETPGEFRY